MSDLIELIGLRARGNHGVFDHERAAGQEFVVDVQLRLPLGEAADSDELGRTVHYGEVAEQVVAAVERDPVDLIETVAERVADVVLGFERVESVRVTVHKPEAPITVPFDDVRVVIERSRR